jgi:hypothetical protein
MGLDTTEWEAAHKKKPRGSHLWNFRFDTDVGSHLVSTDGPWAKTRDRVMKAIQKTHGNVKVRLVP